MLDFSWFIEHNDHFIFLKNILVEGCGPIINLLMLYLFRFLIKNEHEQNPTNGYQYYCKNEKHGFGILEYHIKYTKTYQSTYKADQTCKNISFCGKSPSKIDGPEHHKNDAQ